MNELKLFVERCVRPLKAEGSKKLAMRRELYGHLQAVYEQERPKAASDEEAVQAAILRMGEPSELTKELSAPLSLGDRWTGIVDSLSSRRIDESPWQYAVRSTCLTLIATLVFLIPFVLVSVLMAGEIRFREEFLIRTCIALVLLEPLVSLTCGWVFALFRDHLEQYGWQKRLVPLVAAIGFAFLLLIPLVGWLFVYGMSLDVPAATAALPGWFVLGLLATPGILWAAWIDAKLTRDLREWLELQIDQ